MYWASIYMYMYMCLYLDVLTFNVPVLLFIGYYMYIHTCMWGVGYIHVRVHVYAEVEYPCLSGERRHLPCINFKDSARPAELPRWLSWYSICLERRRSRVRVLPEAALLFLWKKGVVFGCCCLHLPCLYN